MAEGKVIGKLTNIVNFSTDKASLSKVLADIKKVKDAMKGVTQPFAKVQQQMTRANKQQARMKSDYLVVQKQLDKTEKSQLKTAEAIYKAKNKQALAEQKIANQRRAQSVRGLTAKSGAGKASGTLFADMLRGEAKQDAASLRRQRETERAHTQAIIEDRKRSLNEQQKFNKMFDAEMNRIYNERKKDVLKRHNTARKERRARWKQEARDLKEMNRLHGQALAENMKRDQKIQTLYDRRRQAVLSARSSATSKRIARREREQSRASREQGPINNRNMRMDRRAQATQEWFGSTFGRGGQRKAASLYGDLRSGKINAEQYSTRLRSLRADLYRTQRAQRSFNQSIHDMRGAFVQATASYTAFAGLMGISNIGKQYEAQKAQMLVATGSKEKAASQLDYLRSETYRLGLGREQASQGYTQIAMAGQADLGVEGVNKLFTGLSELSTAVQLTPFKYEKVVNSLSQMLSKKQIYAEDYQQQFAEQLAGGAEAMQKAVSKWAGRDIGTDEMKAMMKDGKLIAKEILPLLAKEMAELARNGEALKDALKGLAVIESRMKTSFDNMLANVYRGGLSEGLKDLYTTLDDMFFLMSQGDSKVGKFLKGFIDGARESLIWVHDTLLDIYYLITEDLGVKGVNAEMLGKAAYYTSIIVALNTITGLMKWFISAPLLNGVAALAGKILGLATATEAVAAAQVTANAAVATSAGSGWIAMLLSQSKLLLAALSPVAAVVAVIASAAAILNLAQSKYNDFSAEQKADWQQKMTTMNASATQGYYTKSGLEQLGSQGNLPNTNPYRQMMQANADITRQLQETILNAPPLRVDVRVEESELSKFIKFRVEEGMQRQIQSIIPTGAPSLVVK